MATPHRYVLYTCIVITWFSSVSGAPTVSHAEHGHDEEGSETSYQHTHHILTGLHQFVDMKEGRNYDYRLTPLTNPGVPLEVNISLYITHMVDLREDDMEYTMDLYFRQEWHDYRLVFGEDIQNVTSVSVPDVYYSDIWLPDTFIQNGKKEEQHKVTMENKGFRVFSNGSIFYSQRLTLKVWCSVNLESFPMDVQSCQLRLMTYRYDTAEVALKWLEENPVEIGPEVRLVVFTMEVVDVDTCVQDFTHSGSYSCLVVKFDFRRLLGYYATQIFVPSCLLVVLSWVSFWLDPSSSPARVSLGILTILTMHNQMTAMASSSLPKVSYVKAIDVWITVCQVFLFASLVEFAVVNTMSRRSKDIQVTQQRKEQRHKGYNKIEKIETGPCGLPYLTARRVDKISRLLFPSTFLVFVMIYWIVYTTTTTTTT